MFRIEWMQLVSLSVPLILMGVLYWQRRGRSPAWLREVATALGGTVTGPQRVEGMTAGLPWTATLNLSLSSQTAPSWRLSFPTVTSTDFVVRAETKKDERWKKRGFIEELSVGDATFDAHHLVLCAQPEAAGALLRHAPLREALSALPLGEPRQPEGGILWVQAGQGLEVELDVSALNEGMFHERLAELFRQVVALVQVLREAPRRGTPGLWRARLFDTRTEWGWMLLGLWCVAPVGFSLQGLLAVWTGALKVPFSFWGSAALGLVGAGALVVPYMLRLRGSPLFHRRILYVPLVLVAGFVLGPLVTLGLNARDAGPVQSREVKVLSSWPQHVGILEFWELELEGLGHLRLPYDQGEPVRKQDTVRVQVAPGALGVPRVQSLEPVQRGAGAKPAPAP